MKIGENSGPSSVSVAGNKFCLTENFCQNDRFDVPHLAGEEHQPGGMHSLVQSEFRVSYRKLEQKGRLPLYQHPGNLVANGFKAQRQ